MNANGVLFSRKLPGVPAGEGSPAALRDCHRPGTSGIHHHVFHFLDFHLVGLFLALGSSPTAVFIVGLSLVNGFDTVAGQE